MDEEQEQPVLAAFYAREPADIDLYAHAQQMAIIIDDMAQQLRAWEKYGHDFKDADEAVEKIRDYFSELCGENHLPT